MTTTTKQTRPAGNGTGAQERFATCPESMSDAPAPSRLDLVDLSDLDLGEMGSRQLVGALVVVVVTERPGTVPHYRRRCFLTAAAAERAVKAARARGERAGAYLAETKPLLTLGVS